MKSKLTLLLFILFFSFVGMSQKISGEKKANELLEKLTTEIQLTTAQQETLKPLFVAYNAYKKLKKKEKKQRKELGKTLSEDQKKALKKEEKDKKKTLKKKVSEILNKEQYTGYLKIVEEMKDKKTD